MAGVHTSYYLVHSMVQRRVRAGRPASGSQFRRRRAPVGIRRIIYLGGLGNEDQALSAHLRSRHEVADILRSSGIPTIEFRASIVIGSGSLSFEMIRALVQRLPVMICPRWVRVKAQPIAIEDVIAYLMEALRLPAERSSVFEIGGADQVSYGEIMQEYARQCGLRRWMISVPVLTPRLSSLWLGVVTPIYARIGRKLIDSMRNPTLVRDASALMIFSVKPKGLKESIERALHHEDQEFAKDSLVRRAFVERKAALLGWRTNRDKADRFPERASIGLARCGVCADPADWRLKRLVLREFSLVVPRVFWIFLWAAWACAEAVEIPTRWPREMLWIFWRVETFKANRQLTLVAEMKIPGRAWLQFEVEPNSRGSVIKQTAIFDPAGLAGLFYWYALYPAHLWIFSGMLRKIAGIAEQQPRIAHTIA